MAVAADTQRLRLMLRSLTASLTCNPSRGRPRDIRNSRRGKGEILVMADTRSRCGPRLEMGLEMVQGMGREIGPKLDRDTGTGRQVRRRGRSIRCGLRHRLDICRSGWSSITICRWISRNVCFGRSQALTG